jgi:hypothetical protein
MPSPIFLRAPRENSDSSPYEARVTSSPLSGSRIMMLACCALSVLTTRRTMISRITSLRSWSWSVVLTWNSAVSSLSRTLASARSSSSRDSALHGAVELTLLEDGVEAEQQHEPGERDRDEERVVDAGGHAARAFEADDARVQRRDDHRERQQQRERGGPQRPAGSLEMLPSDLGAPAQCRSLAGVVAWRRPGVLRGCDRQVRPVH